MTAIQLLRTAAAVARRLDDAATLGPWGTEVRDDLGDSNGHVLWCVTAPADVLHDHAERGAPLVARSADAGAFSQAEADVLFAAAMRQIARPLAELFETALVAPRVSPELVAVARVLVEHAEAVEARC